MTSPDGQALLRELVEACSLPEASGAQAAMDIIVARLEKETAEIRVGCLERLLDRGISTDEALSLILTTSEKDHLAAVRRQAHAQAMAAHREEMARLETGRLEMERRLLEIKAALPGPGA